MKRQKAEKIVVYGGMFDPPHKGHFSLIRAALRDIVPDTLYVVPGFGSPFKEIPGADFAARAAMVRSGLRASGLGGDARIKVHPYEAGRGRVTYTWRTIAFFRRLHPGASLYFLMGSDCLETFRRWKNYRRILSSARLLVGVRPGFSLRGSGGLPCSRLRGRFPAVSSTALKAGLFSGSRVPGLPGEIGAYIAARGLYLGGLRRLLKRGMPPARFRHTLGVTRLALALAQRYGADPRRAALAALLHDVARGLSKGDMLERASVCRPGMPFFRAAARNAPVVLHPYAGAVIAEKKYGVKDREVLRAIRGHAFGRVSPGLLDKIIFTADLAEAGRDFPEARAIRKLAFKDLDAAYAAAQRVKLAHVIGRGGWVHPESVKAWNSPLEKNRS